MMTRALVPLNVSAVPNFPLVVQVAPLIVPVWPLPETSATVVPVPSLKLYAATRPAPAGGVVPDTVKAVITVCAAVRDTTQLPVPLQAPLQPVKVEPDAGVAVRVTLVPLG